jgi:aspartate kinase
MKIRVMKFGGTSVRTHEARETAALRVISAVEQGDSPIVVVSAIGRRGEPYATDTLVEFLREIDPNVQPDDRELDLLMACGEILSAVVFAQILKTMGYQAMAMRGGQAGIRTDGVYGNARILGINPMGLFEVLHRGSIPVVCGFQGVWEKGGLPGSELTTLGRGGSDTTASALAAAVNADAVEIYTDVDGVKTADPDFVKEAPTLDAISYQEVAEIAHLGAKVLHPRAAEIANRFNIPLRVKNTFSTHTGTQIVQEYTDEARAISGVTHTGKLVHFNLCLDSVLSGHRTMLESRVLEMLAKYGIGLFMVNLNPDGISFAIERDQYQAALDLFDGLVMPLGDDDARVYVMQAGDKPSQAAETQLSLLKALGDLQPVRINITEGCTMVSVVGTDAMNQSSMFLRALTTLRDAKVPVIQTADSGSSLSCLIPESELETAVQVLHDKYNLEAAQ